MPNLGVVALKQIFFFLSFVLAAVPAAGEIFGDGYIGNGIEDSRIPLASSDSASFQRFVGTLSCGDRIQGSAVMLDARVRESSESRPVLVTAGHVLAEPNGTLKYGCVYRPATSSGTSYPIIEAAAGRTVDDGGSMPSLIDQFSQDWAVVALDSRPGWKGYSIPFVLTEDRKITNSAWGGRQAFLVGYDSAGNRFMIDSDCEFGSLDAESAFGGSEALVWDDCDSVRGSSGGALFALNDGVPRIAGIRVGNVFDVGLHPQGPGPGGEFDLNANINLTRLIDQDVVQAIRALLEANPWQ